MAWRTACCLFTLVGYASLGEAFVPSSALLRPAAFDLRTSRGEAKLAMRLGEGFESSRGPSVYVPDSVSTSQLAELLRMRQQADYSQHSSTFVIEGQRYEQPPQQQQHQQVLDEFVISPFHPIEAEQMMLRSTLKEVYVLIFNPDCDDEGIYSLWMQGRNIVLGFQSKMEAARYSMMLKAQDFYCPVPQAMSTSELMTFCGGADVDMQLIPSGAYVVPPEVNKETLEFNPTEYLDDYEAYHASEKEKPLLEEHELRHIRNQLNALFDSQ